MRRYLLLGPRELLLQDLANILRRKRTQETRLIHKLLLLYDKKTMTPLNVKLI